MQELPADASHHDLAVETMAVTSAADERGFAAFRDYVFADASLQARLRRVVEREEFIALVVEVGQERGFHFTAADVASAIVRGHTAWLMSGSPVLQESR
jgi:hypothetical protein